MVDCTFLCLINDLLSSTFVNVKYVTFRIQPTTGVQIAGNSLTKLTQFIKYVIRKENMADGSAIETSHTAKARR